MKKFPVVPEAEGFVCEGLRRECGISLEDRAGDMFAQRKNFFFRIEELPTKSYFTNRGIELVRRV